MTPAPGDGGPTEASGRLEVLLQSIRQGDVISVGAVAIVGSATSQVVAAAGGSRDEAHDQTAGVASVTIESASGWYAVLSQDCDIVRTVDLEPCLHVAPVVYIPEEDWARLDAGQTSYRQFALPPDRIEPLPPAHEALGHRRKPVVDIRYVTNVDKTALLSLPDIQRRTPLGPRQRARFAQWVGSRYARIPFDDRVIEEVLPAIRPVLATLVDQLDKSTAGQRRPAVSFVGCISEWYVRQMDRNVELMGRLDLSRARVEKLLKTTSGEPVLDETRLQAGAAALRKALVAKLPSGTGYALAVTYFDFDDLGVSQYETYALWVVQDDPELSQSRA